MSTKCLVLLYIAVGVAGVFADPEPADHSNRLIRSPTFAPGDFPGGSTTSGQEQNTGSWNVGVNHDSGAGPSIRAEGQRNIYTHPSGNFRVDAYGHAQAGQGQKPSYGGGLTAEGRWKREANPGDNGRVEVRGEKRRGDSSVRAEVTRDLWRSKDGNTRLEARGHYEKGSRGREDKGGSVVLSHRWRREAQGGDRGSVSVTREQTSGQKPVYTAQGNARVWQSQDRNSRVDVNGHYQRGGGMRPNYGAGVTFTHRFRREAEPEVEMMEDDQSEVVMLDEESLDRQKRQAQTGSSGKPPASNNGNRGSVSVGVEKSRGQKPVYTVDGNARVWQSQNKRSQVDVNGNYQGGGGMRPNYGAGVRFTHRFRRDVLPETEAEDDQEVVMTEEKPTVDRQKRQAQGGDRGSASVTVEQNRGQKPIYRAEGSGRVWQSPDKNARVDVNGHYQRGGGMRPSYGAGVTYTRRFRRDAELDSDEEYDQGEVVMAEEESLGRQKRQTQSQGGDRGSASITVEQNRGQKPIYRAEGSGRVWQSPDRNSRVDVNGHYQRGGGMRPSYGAGVTYTRRFRRDADPEVEEDAQDVNIDEPSDRQKREAQSGDRGSVSISREQTRGQKPVYRAEGSGRVWQSKDRKAQVDVNGNYQRGGGMRPSYGAGVTYTRRFRRDVDPEVEEDVQDVMIADEPSERQKRQAQSGDRGSVSISREQTRGQKPVYRAEGSGRVWQSKDRKAQVDVNGNYQRGGGMRPSYGAGVTYTRRFRRGVEAEVEEGASQDDVKIEELSSNEE